MDLNQATSDITFETVDPEAPPEIPAVKEIVVDGDYLIVGIDISCSLSEILDCISGLMKPYMEYNGI